MPTTPTKPSSASRSTPSSRPAPRSSAAAPPLRRGAQHARVEVCLGLPGALPVLNREAPSSWPSARASRWAADPRRSRFARKNYFYPDLPKGYQISSSSCRSANGTARSPSSRRRRRSAWHQRIHMEEDAGKNLHGRSAATSTLVDLNRAGTPLIEIVSAPTSAPRPRPRVPPQALRDILIFAGVNDGNLEEGSFRCDANVSIRPGRGDPSGRAPRSRTSTRSAS
jgi:aspartyl-tRNA(Asn)/glutamyl-tRNA(Gln) amidotransferase subunit B